MIETGFLITAFVTLFVVIDPPGLVPMFIALTQGMTADHRRAMARRASHYTTLGLRRLGITRSGAMICVSGLPRRHRRTSSRPVRNHDFAQ